MNGMIEKRDFDVKNGRYCAISSSIFVRTCEIAISTRGHLPARFFSPPKVIFPAQGAARGFAQQTQGRSRGLEKLPRAVKKTKGSAQGLNVAFHTWCLENVVFVGVDIPKILLAAGQREEIDEQLPSGLRPEGSCSSISCIPY